jgi:hypothetical protein
MSPLAWPVKIILRPVPGFKCVITTDKGLGDENENTHSNEKASNDIGNSRQIKRKK